MISKKQLQEQYSLSHNTVTETLKACGLDTSKREYSEEEINQRFLAARAMLDEGKTYDDVKATFLSQGQSAPASVETVDSGEFAQQVAAEVEAGTREIIRQAAGLILNRLPAMTIDVLNEMARDNEVQAVYQRYRRQVMSEIAASSETALPPSADNSQN